MNEKQSSSQLIEKEIDSKNWIIYGKVRNGKTLNAISIALDFYPRIYSNFQIYNYGESIVNFVQTYERLKNIRFSHVPGVLIIDEAGLNANGKDGASKDGRLLESVLFLCGKKNLSLVWIAQRFESIKIDVRVLADVILEVRKIQRGKKHPIFVVTKKKAIGIRLEQIAQYKFDPISMYKVLGITYNTLEESKLVKTKNIKKAEDKKNILVKN